MNANPNQPLNTLRTTSNAQGPAQARLVITIPEFGARWAAKRRTVWTWMRLGLPHMKFSPRKTLIPVGEGDRWVETKFMRRRQK